MALSIPDKAKLNAKCYTELCFLDKLKNTSLLYCLVLFPSRMVRLLPRQSWLKTGLPTTAENLLAKINGYQTRRTLTFLTITSE